MKALFIGGTGTISMAITRLLSKDENWEVYLLNRGSRSGELPANVKTITADISNEEEVNALLKDEFFDVVGEFIGFVPAQVERDIRLFKGRTNQYIHKLRFRIRQALQRLQDNRGNRSRKQILGVFP